MYSGRTIDLRSDTVTLPTPGMLDAMMSAPVGDDILDGDPSVKELEQKAASLLGFDAALFCPSGTMSNQIGIKVLTQPYDEVICYQWTHIYLEEGGGLAGNSGVSVRLVAGDRGRLSTGDIASGIHDVADPHRARTALVALENTVGAGGGSYYTLSQIAALSAFSRSRKLALHLDGARLFNALVACGEDPASYGRHVDTASICLSKGLGAPVGSLLLCHRKHLQKAVRVRKALGGAMRQVGYMAAAGLYALEHHVKRLAEDHVRAKVIECALQKAPWVRSVYPVDTNIIIFEVDKNPSAARAVELLRRRGIRALPWGRDSVRMVTHLDIDDAMLEEVEKAIGDLL